MRISAAAFMTAGLVTGVLSMPAAPINVQDNSGLPRDTPVTGNSNMVPVIMVGNEEAASDRAIMTKLKEEMQSPDTGKSEKAAEVVQYLDQMFSEEQAHLQKRLGSTYKLAPRLNVSIVQMDGVKRTNKYQHVKSSGYGVRSPTTYTNSRKGTATKDSDESIPPQKLSLIGVGPKNPEKNDGGNNQTKKTGIPTTNIASIKKIPTIRRDGDASYTKPSDDLKAKGASGTERKTFQPSVRKTAVTNTFTSSMRTDTGKVDRSVFSTRANVTRVGSRQINAQGTTVGRDLVSKDTNLSLSKISPEFKKNPVLNTNKVSSQQGLAVERRYTRNNTINTLNKNVSGTATRSVQSKNNFRAGAASLHTSTTDKGKTEVVKPWRVKQRKMDESEIFQQMIQRARKEGRLNLSNRGLKEIPKAVYDMYEAQRSAIDMDLGTDSTEKWWENEAMTYMNFSGNEIEMVEEKINVFNSLEHFDLSYNLIKQLPTSFGEFNYLTVVSLAGNKFTEFPSVLTELEGIEEVYLQRNEISILPSDMGGLKKSLKILDLSNNKIEKVKSQLEGMQVLKKVELSNNTITEMPRGVDWLRGVEELGLSNNKLEYLFEFGDSVDGEIGLDNIVYLDASGNELRSLFKDEANQDKIRFPNLSTLMLSKNNMTKMPCVINPLQMPRLTILSIAENGIEDISGIFSRHGDGKLKLRRIDISNNRIKRLPRELIKQCDDLIGVDFEGNPLSARPQGTTRSHLEAHFKRFEGMSGAGDERRSDIDVEWMDIDKNEQRIGGGGGVHEMVQETMKDKCDKKLKALVESVGGKTMDLSEKLDVLKLDEANGSDISIKTLLDAVKNQNIGVDVRKLVLKNNRLEKIPLEVVELICIMNTGELEEIDLSNNQLLNVDELYEVLSNENMSLVGQKLAKTKVLDLSNNKISHFGGLNHYGNKERVLKLGQVFPELRELDLSNNRLTDIGTRY
ncbi:Leucine-rich repeat-containing protein 40 [Zancudomyces culisetae]|uniref:Leucine-rich repeat-containing protein 40 n=1 Tax=Zancudomyces culisetae TaxID=1213189 RepID=A0A1R1PM34_ZANCU|nr:Leucine-rich repeat-containing protein 40 [Zancudomyces culisetae]|eukprot:OMH82007.1 Leucine-rich repeat-containing protein 40 [Zancudomyces culisetae]